MSYIVQVTKEQILRKLFQVQLPWHKFHHYFVQNKVYPVARF